MVITAASMGLGRGGNFFSSFRMRVESSTWRYILIDVHHVIFFIGASILRFEAAEYINRIFGQVFTGFVADEGASGAESHHHQ